MAGSSSRSVRSSIAVHPSSRGGGLDHAQRDRVLEAFGWVTELRGSAFSDFFDAAIRSEQPEVGFVRGQEVLRDLGWSS